MPIPDKDLNQYMAVYKLVSEYMTAFSQDYIYPQVILEVRLSICIVASCDDTIPWHFCIVKFDTLSNPQDMKAVPAFKHVTADPDVEDFLEKVVPMCWELVTIYKPPIIVSSSCDVPTVIDGALHEKHPESHGKSSVIQGFLFPLVYTDYGGDVEQKAMVITRMKMPSRET